MSDLPIEDEKYFMVVTADDPTDLTCFEDPDIKEGDVFGIKAVEVGETETGHMQVRMKLVKIRSAQHKKDGIVIAKSIY